MAQWQKKFEQWETAKTPVDATEVEALLKRVFTDRVRTIDGTSHQYKVDVPELRENPKYQFGFMIIPLFGGQKVKAVYLQKAYEAAILLELYPPQA